MKMMMHDELKLEVFRKWAGIHRYELIKWMRECNQQDPQCIISAISAPWHCAANLSFGAVGRALVDGVNDRHLSRTRIGPRVVAREVLPRTRHMHGGVLGVILCAVVPLGRRSKQRVHMVGLLL